ncbi:hypothetical protein C2G38_2182192 [Gigaspora rosea]|uniref:TLDc domain-containing protein n=1 Tax=Gigaspora rosea TaxID=44941 RepID=A0A397VJI6_9GLOM|nr:hypothetical protein C2G38_2182192 [Gigaspora rosea]
MELLVNYPLICVTRKQTFIARKVKNSDEILGGYNPISWNRSKNDIFNSDDLCYGGGVIYTYCDLVDEVSKFIKKLELTLCRSGIDNNRKIKIIENWTGSTRSDLYGYGPNWYGFCRPDQDPE